MSLYKIIAISLCLSFGLLISSSMAHAAGQDLRILTFNIGYTAAKEEGLSPARCGSHLQKQIQDSKNRMMQIATYLKNKGIEVALFQEIVKRCGVYEEWTGLVEALDVVGYPMDIALSNSERPNHEGLHTLIVSKYPIDQAGIQTHPTTAYEDAKRWYVVAPVETEMGRLTFYNLHTRASVVCAALSDFFTRGIVDGNKQRILGGDFNMKISQDPNWYRKNPGCNTGADGLQLKKLVDEFTIQPNEFIDLIMIPKDQPFQFIDTYRDGTSGIRSDHVPVISNIKLNLQPKTTPEKAGDADRDGDVDIFDHNTILQFFGKSECSVNVVKECTIDIFDFNEVIARL